MNFLIGKVHLIKTRYFCWCALLLCTSLPSCLIERNTVKFGVCLGFVCLFVFNYIFFTWDLALLMVLEKWYLVKHGQIYIICIVCIVWGGVGCFFTEFIYCI